MKNPQASIFREGHNCRGIAKANRVALVTDGEDYFRVFMQTAERAKESIILHAWDFNSHARRGSMSRGTPEMPGDFLNHLAETQSPPAS